MDEILYWGNLSLSRAHSAVERERNNMINKKDYTYEDALSAMNEEFDRYNIMIQEYNIIAYDKKTVMSIMTAVNDAWAHAFEELKKEQEGYEEVEF